MMSGYNNRPKKQFYNRPNYGYSNEMPQSRPPLPLWNNNIVSNPWLASQESQLQYYENGIDNFTPRLPDPPNISYNNKNNIQNEQIGTMQHQTPINNEQIINENMKAVPPHFHNNSHYTSNYRSNNMVSYPIPAKYQDTGGNSAKTTESSNKISKYSLDNRSKFDNHSKNHTSSHYKHNSYDNTSRSSQDSSYYRRSNSVESRSLPRSRPHSSSPNRKSSSRSTSNNKSHRNSSAKDSSTKTCSSEASSSRRHGQEKTSSIPASKPVTAKIPEKLPKKLDKDTILKLVNSTTRYEPAMQKLLREQRSKLTQNLRNKYNNDTNKDSMAANSAFADEEITDGIIPNFTLNLTADLQFLQEALDNVDEKEAQDAAKLSSKINNDCDKTPPGEDKNSTDLILLDEWSAADDKETEELISYNNYDLGPLELPSNIDELQLPSDVSSFFNFTEINKDETTSLLNSGVVEDQDFFNTVKIDENSENAECNQSTIATTTLSPIKSVLDSEVLSLPDDLVENKQQINDQNENVISEMCKENFNEENYCSSFKTDEIVKNDAYLSPFHNSSLRNNENYLSPFKEEENIETETQQNYVEENIQNENLENYVSPFNNDEDNNQNENLENYVSPFKDAEENIQNENLENYVSPFKDNEETIPNENLENYVSPFKDNEEIIPNENLENYVSPFKDSEETIPNENYVSPFKDNEETISNENLIPENYIDPKENIENCVKGENYFFDETELKNELYNSPIPEEKMAINSLEVKVLSPSSPNKVTFPVETIVLSNIPAEIQTIPQITEINKTNLSSKKNTKKSTKEKKLTTKKRVNNKSTIRKPQKEKIKPIRIKLIKDQNSIKKNLNYFRQIIRAEILNTKVANPFKQQKKRKIRSNNNINEEIFENNVQNISKTNRETPESSYLPYDKKILSEESQNENIQNTDNNSISSEKSLTKIPDTIDTEKCSPTIPDTINSEKFLLNIPNTLKSENLENIPSVLSENSELVSTQFTNDNTNMSADKLTNEDDVSSDNNPDNIRLSISSNENSFGSRKWRSPGEKKFIAASSSTNKRSMISSTSTTDSSTNGKEEILLKIYDIDVQIQRLMDEKMNLYKQLMAQSEECQENMNPIKKSVARKLDLDTEIQLDSKRSSTPAASEMIHSNGTFTTVEQSLNSTNDNSDLGQRLNMEIDIKENPINAQPQVESNSPTINNENEKGDSEIKIDTINSDTKQTNKRNKHSDSKSKIVNRNSDKENVSKRKTKKNQQENVDKLNSKIVNENVEQVEKVEIKKAQKIVEKNDKFESKKSSPLHDNESTEKVEIAKKAQKTAEKDIESKKSPKKSRRERSSSSKKSSSKDKYHKEMRNDESETKKPTAIDHPLTKRSVKASSITPNSDAEDKTVKNNSNRFGVSNIETHKTKNSKRKRDPGHNSDSNSDAEDKTMKNNSNRVETPDSETRKTKNSKRKRDQEHDSDSKSSLKRHSNKKRKKKYVLSDSDEIESQIEKQPSLPSINIVETTRTRRCSLDTRQKSIEHELLPTMKINYESTIIKPCIVPLVRINPEKYWKKVEIKEEFETIHLESTVSEDEHKEVKLTDSKVNEKCIEQLDENVVNISNESKSDPLVTIDQDIQQKSDEGTVSQTSSSVCSKNSINNNDVECSTNKLDCFKCSEHTGSILYVKIYKNSIIAGGEDGKIYKYNVNNGELLSSVSAHQAAITSFLITKNNDGLTCIYSGSLDTYFKCFEIETFKELSNIQINTSIQCMDADWGYIFIGTVSGHLYRYSINSNSMEDEKRRIGDEAILALKTQVEGARRILISAPRNELISIRDAMSGLLLRYITFTTTNFTIYSIMLSQHGSIIYCGTNKKLILGYNFSDGLLAKELVAGKGIVCLLEYQKLLFAGCYDGFIYVFDILTNQLVSKFMGPGGMILALAVLDNKVIIGSKNSCLEVRTMPEVVLKYINENRR